MQIYQESLHLKTYKREYKIYTIMSCLFLRIAVEWNARRYSAFSNALSVLMNIRKLYRSGLH